MLRRERDTDDDVLRNWRVFDVTAAEPASADDRLLMQHRQTDKPTDRRTERRTYSAYGLIALYARAIHDDFVIRLRHRNLTSTCLIQTTARRPPFSVDGDIVA